MKKRLPKSLHDADFLPLWRHSHRFTATGLRLVERRSGKGDHLTGGPARHKGAKCPGCRRQLTLVWDLDLNDPLFPEYVRTGFAPADRLPFYICWQCVASSYCVASNDQVKCFAFDHHTDSLDTDESPFADSPNELPQRKIAFRRVPSTVDALLSLEESVGLEKLDPTARSALNDYYGETITSTWDLPFSQFGGLPLLYQRHRNFVCPNPKCPASELTHPYGELSAPYLMKELALIHHDNEPVLAEHCFQLHYVICGICYSLRAEYRCS